MKIEYNIASTGNPPYTAILPDTYTRDKHYLWLMHVHGIGERSDGRLVDLQNITEGFDYNGDGNREPAIITDDMKRAVDLYNMVLIIPTYQNFFDAAKVNAVYNHAMLKYGVISRFIMTGFSLGGGAVVQYITSSAENAKRVLVAAPCAPVSGLGNYRPDKTLPIHFFVNTDDTNAATNISVTKSLATTLGAPYTAFPKSGHGGYSEAHTIAPPTASGGLGVTNIAENIYEWGIDVFNNGPRVIKIGTVTKPSDPIPTTGTLTAKASYTGTGPDIILDGRASTGWASASWSVSQVPTGVNKYATIVTEGAGWITGKAKLPVQGTYIIDLIVKDNTGREVKDTLLINYGAVQPAPKTLTSFDSVTDLITFSDGSTETGRASYSGGKWVIVASSGVKYEL